MSDVWVPRFACPECRGHAIGQGGGTFRCGRCRREFTSNAGVYHFLTPERLEAISSFARRYRMVRERDGYRSTKAGYYRMLPSVAPDDPQASVWRIRRESYAHLLEHALPAVWRGPAHILDLGAGSGWLSHRLASFGHHVVALDRLDDDRDGLGVCGLYPVAFTVVQADFDALPFEPGQFDLVLFNGSLHYAPDPAATLAEARRMLAAGGALAVSDSPMFVDDADGRRMVDAQRHQLASTCGALDGGDAGRGYLTFDALDRTAVSMGLRSSFVPSRGPLGWRIRRRVAQIRLRRPAAMFGVWVAR